MKIKSFLMCAVVLGFFFAGPGCGRDGDEVDAPSVERVEREVFTGRILLLPVEGSEHLPVHVEKPVHVIMELNSGERILLFGDATNILRREFEGEEVIIHGVPFSTRQYGLDSLRVVRVSGIVRR